MSGVDVLTPGLTCGICPLADEDVICPLSPVPPSIKGGNASTGVVALLDTPVTLECEGRGVPPPTLSWYRDGLAVPAGRQSQYLERGHVLKILRVEASDAGRYTCRAASVAGSAERSYQLEVYCKNLALESSLSSVRFWERAERAE